MKPSEILIDAAKRIDSGSSRSGCMAIVMACVGFGGYSYHKASEYFRLMRPEGMNVGLLWFGNHTPKNQRRRVIALTLAAAIAESEGD